MRMAPANQDKVAGQGMGHLHGTGLWSKMRSELNDHREKSHALGCDCGVADGMTRNGHVVLKNRIMAGRSATLTLRDHRAITGPWPGFALRRGTRPKRGGLSPLPNSAI